MRLRRSRLGAPALLLVIVLLATTLFTTAGCGGGTAGSGTATSAKTAVYTDMLGRKVTLTTNVQRIVLIRTMDFYMLSAILGKELDTKLIAVGESFPETDIDGYKKYSQVYPNLSRLVDVGSIYDDAISLETMVKLNPDLIIADKQFYNYSCLNKMIQAGLPVVFTDDNSDPFHGPQESMQMLGRMLGKEKRADEISAYADSRTDAVLGRVVKLEAAHVPKPKLYFECGDVNPEEIGATRGDTSNGWGLIWERLGADNIGVGNGSNPMNPEQVLVDDPDVIVIGGANWDPDGNIMRMGYFAAPTDASVHLGLYTNRAGWPDLTAIKTGRLHAIHFNIAIYPYNFAGFESMAKFLYPAQFADLNPDRDLHDFFTKYMPVKYSGIFWADWQQTVGR